LDPDPELRKEVAESVAKVKNREVLPALEKARVEDTDKEVREEADKAIKKIKGS
jgi:HEAT repeat protein